MAGPGAALVAAPPLGPVDPVLEVVCWSGDEGSEEQAISLRVSGISPGGGGWARSTAAVTDRKATPRMARVTHRAGLPAPRRAEPRIRNPSALRPRPARGVGQQR